MAIERTLAIIKPDAVKRGLTADILEPHPRREISDRRASNRCASPRRSRRFLRRASRARPFFGELTDFMSSGKAVVIVLEAEGAIANGATPWAPPIPPKPRRAPSARNSAPASSTTARTARTRRKPPLSKSAISSPARTGLTVPRHRGVSLWVVAFSHDIRAGAPRQPLACFFREPWFSTFSPISQPGKIRCAAGTPEFL